MNGDKLQERLLEKFQQSELAHFYLLRAHPHEIDPQDALEKWVEVFLQKVWEQERQGQTTESYLEHPDFLIVKNPKPARSYLSSENPGLVEWHKTQDYGPMEFKRRWIIVHHAHTLTESFCHKQLKTLEEPNDRTTIIFTDPMQTQLLKTIESRAIKVQIPVALFPRNAKRAKECESFDRYLATLPKESQNEASSEMQRLLQAGKLHKTLEWLKDNPQFSRCVIEWVLDFERTRSQAQQLSAIGNRLKWFEKSSVHHNSAQERWLTLLAPYFASK